MLTKYKVTRPFDIDNQLFLPGDRLYISDTRQYIRNNKDIIVRHMKLNNIKVLIGCEESQTIANAFRKLGVEAYSCDIIECSGGHPEYHLLMDVFEAIKLRKWDLIIIHPPCTCIAVSGNRTYAPGKAKYKERINATLWTKKLWDECIYICNHVCMENPVGCLNTMSLFPKPQYIQPWQFGHGETKKTGLWLYGLPNLIPTNIVNGREQKIWKMAPSAERSKLRSKTYKGIAEAIATQFTDYMSNVL